MLKQLDIYNFRNISKFKVAFTDGINVIAGDNGEGKSSILEAIYHLCTGQSFRTRLVRTLIQNNQQQFMIRGVLNNGNSIAVQKSVSESPLVKVNGEKVSSASELAPYLPCLLFHEAIFQIIDSGPAVRRGFLDWGLFHVEPTFHQLYLNYKKVLSSRNSLLKKQVRDKTSYIAWEKQLIDIGLEIYALRDAYLNRLLPVFNDILDEFNIDWDIDIAFWHGWGQSLASIDMLSLTELYQQAREKDLSLGYTTKGCHRADIRITSLNKSAKDTLSRGQQKIIAIALKLAQARCLQQQCIFLVDDLAAELDKSKQEKILKLFHQSGHQVILTSLDEDSQLIKNYASNSFHVKQCLYSAET